MSCHDIVWFCWHYKLSTMCSESISEKELYITIFTKNFRNFIITIKYHDIFINISLKRRDCDLKNNGTLFVSTLFFVKTLLQFNWFNWELFSNNTGYLVSIFVSLAFRNNQRCYKIVQISFFGNHVNPWTPKPRSSLGLGGLRISWQIANVLVCMYPNK